jgi:hypothetical protein
MVGRTVALKVVAVTNEIKALTIDELVSRYAISNNADGKSPRTVKWYTELMASFS